MKQFGDVCQDADWQKMQSVQKNLRVLIFVKIYPCFFFKAEVRQQKFWYHEQINAS